MIAIKTDISALADSHQNVLIQKSHSMCECAGTSATAVRPRHRPHHRYIIALAVLDNSNAAQHLKIKKIKKLTSLPPPRSAGAAVSTNH